VARRRRRDKENDRRDAAELEELRPYLGLAREIHHEVDRVASDSAAPVESLVDAIARIPDQERLQVARTVFGQLPVEQQWAVLADTFDDEELRTALAIERAAFEQRMRIDDGLRRRAAAARAAGQLDTTTLEVGDVVSLGLFAVRDVQAGVRRGRASDAAARVMTVRAEQPATGVLRVLTDTFNPDGGYFVTASYDQSTWAAEQLDSHTLVRLGAAADGGAGTIEPVLYPGARVDAERLGHDGPIIGRLSLGWVTLGPVDVFGG